MNNFKLYKRKDSVLLGIVSPFNSLPLQERPFSCLQFGEEDNIHGYTFERKSNYPPGMRRRSDVSFRSHIGWDVTDHTETSSQRRNRYVNETDLFETSHW